MIISRIKMWPAKNIGKVKITREDKNSWPRFFLLSLVDTCCYPFLEGLLVLSAKEWCYFRVCVLYKTLPGAGICVLPGSSVPPKVLFLVGAGEMHGFSLLPASKLPMSF